jgi:hypothetical protein
MYDQPIAVCSRIDRERERERSETRRPKANDGASGVSILFSLSPCKRTDENTVRIRAVSFGLVCNVIAAGARLVCRVSFAVARCYIVDPSQAVMRLDVEKLFRMGRGQLLCGSSSIVCTDLVCWSGCGCWNPSATRFRNLFKYNIFIRYVWFFRMRSWANFKKS